MSDPVAVAAIGALLILIVFFVMVFLFRDRIRTITAGPSGIAITLTIREEVQELLVKAEGGKESQSVNQTQLVKTRRRIRKLKTRLDKTVVWVDDYPKSNNYQVQALKLLGIRVTQVASNKDAYKAIVDLLPDLVITDIGRSKQQMNGLDLVSTLAEQHPDLPIIVYTGLSSAQSAKNEVLARGASAITASPAELTRLTIDLLK